jgi:signal transduction histidine kinase
MRVTTMDKEEARKELESENAYARLQAVRALARQMTSDESSLLRETLAKERDAYVRQAIADALGRPSRAAQQLLPDDGIEAEGAPYQEGQQRGFQEAAELFVHELRRIVGLLAVAAASDLGEQLATSRTAAYVKELSDLADAVEQLGDTQRDLDIESFDLSALLRDSVARESESTRVQVVMPDMPPLEVSGQPRLVELAARNGIRNAIEATELASEPHAEVLVAWGETDRDVWVSVLDRGIGLPAKRAKILELGVSSKRGHRGAGLQIAARAARALGGALKLDDRRDGGARFEIRWPRRR